MVFCALLSVGFAGGPALAAIDSSSVPGACDPGLATSACALREASSPRDRAPVRGKLGPTGRKLHALGNNVPVPKPRPVVETAAPSITLAPAATERTITPRSRPADEAADQPVTPTAPPVPEMAMPQMDNACLTALQQRAEVIRASQPTAKDAACRIPDPVELIATKAPYTVDFTDGLKLGCTFAESMVAFVEKVAQPLARHHIGRSLTKLHSGQGFVCRRRNNALTGKLSEHAFGNAMDIIAFEFEGGKRIPVRAASDMADNEAAFFTALRKASCGYFTTVLGPGTNAAHATHLHFDLGRTGGKKRAYRICQ